MGFRKDITGNRYGKLTVVGYAYSQKNRSFWNCQCDCGGAITTSMDNLRQGKTKSCGCLPNKTPQDLTGRRFGRLTALRIAEPRGKGHVKWVCYCDCGAETIVDSPHLTSGHTKSCGCLHREQISKGSPTHGKSHTRLHRIWANMRNRCRNQNVPCYPYYGGRGISVCEEWQAFEPFYDWAMANGYAETLTLDRIDVDGDYNPSNCRWITRKEQMNNTRVNRTIEFNGECHTLTEWNDLLGFPSGRLSNRINTLGWSVEKALTTPVNAKKGRKRDAERI